ncbi:MAG: tyrosine-type recombinase/integrase, partial [Clostridia bacterium]|nr:tyrosine-type recombinase/integrase [Clostridia bacterium]
SRLKKRLGVRSIQTMVKKYLDKIGLSGEGYSVHKLRHTAATLMYQYGNVDILVLKDVLGHENLSTTAIYTHLANNELINASKSHPLSSTQYIKDENIKIKNKSKNKGSD